MYRGVILITDTGIVTVPNEVRMTIGEIADLFDIYYQTAKRHIRAIEKSTVASGNYTMSCTVEGMKIYPDYYGLEMIIVVAFRVQSKNAEIFRNWLMKKAVISAAERPILMLEKWHGISLNLECKVSITMKFLKLAMPCKFEEFCFGIVAIISCRIIINPKIYQFLRI